jgi:hypothetical protein
MVPQFFVVLFFYPEIKGISLEEMQKKLAGGGKDLTKLVSTVYLVILAMKAE